MNRLATPQISVSIGWHECDIGPIGQGTHNSEGNKICWMMAILYYVYINGLLHVRALRMNRDDGTIRAELERQRSDVISRASISSGQAGRRP